MGCDCGMRQMDEEDEKACEESALLESTDYVNHLTLELGKDSEDIFHSELMVVSLIFFVSCQ